MPIPDFQPLMLPMRRPAVDDQEPRLSDATAALVQWPDANEAV
jgi:hypothetical protein